MKSWQTLLNSDNLSADLAEHFSYLADTSGYDPLLKVAFQQANKISIANEKLKIEFSNSADVLIAHQPETDIAKFSHYPSSFIRCIERHASLEFDGLILYAVDSTCNNPFDENDPWNPEFPALFPIEDYSSYWVYHPTETNRSGEPSICPIDHGGGPDAGAPIEENCGALFLKRFCELLFNDDETFSVDDWILEDKPAPDYAEWWASVPGKIKPELSDIDTPTLAELKKITRNTELGLFPEVELQLNDLAFLSPFYKLQELRIGIHTKSLNGIEDLAALKTLEIRNSPIASIEPLRHCHKLEKLDIEGTQVSDISVLRDLRWMKDLRISNTSISDFSPIYHLTKLEYLTLEGLSIQNIDFVTSLKRLQSLSINNTPVQTIRPLLSRAIPVFEFHCEGTVIPLEELVQLQALDNSGWGRSSIYSDFTPALSIVDSNAKTKPTLHHIVNRLNNGFNSTVAFKPLVDLIVQYASFYDTVLFSEISLLAEIEKKIKEIFPEQDHRDFERQLEEVKQRYLKSLSAHTKKSR